MRGVGCEPLLFGGVCFELRKHRIEAVGKLAELVVATLQLDPMGERSRRSPAGRIRDAGQRREHPAGEEPSTDEPEDEQDRQCLGRPRGERIQKV